jgi:hypothetical protein
LRSCRFRTALTEHPADPEAHRRIAQVLGPDYPFEQVVKIRVDLASEVVSPVYTLTQDLKQAVLFPLAADGDARGAILQTIEALS